MDFEVEGLMKTTRKYFKNRTSVISKIKKLTK